MRIQAMRIQAMHIQAMHIQAMHIQARRLEIMRPRALVAPRLRGRGAPALRLWWR